MNRSSFFTAVTCVVAYSQVSYAFVPPPSRALLTCPASHLTRHPVRVGAGGDKASDYLDNLPTNSKGQDSYLNSVSGSSGEPSYLDGITGLTNEEKTAASGSSKVPSQAGQYLDNLPTTGTQNSYLDSVAGSVQGTESYLDAISPPADASEPASSSSAFTQQQSDVADSSDSSDSSNDGDEQPRDVDPAQLQALKDKLLRATLGTNRGFSVRRDERKAISGIIKDLEASNPNPGPNDGFATGDSPLTGEWQLLFTDAPDVLVLSLLPGVSVGQIYQNINGDGTEIFNVVELQPLLPSIIPSTTARLTVKAEGSVKTADRLSIKFLSAKFAQLSFLGRQLEDKLRPLQLKFPKRTQNVGSLDHSFVDEDLRIAHSFGSTFVLLRVKN